MVSRKLIAFTAALALGCATLSTGAFARGGGHGGGHGGGGHGGAHMARGGGGHAHFGGGHGGGHRFAGGHFRGGYRGGYGPGCDPYYSDCGYDPGAAIAGRVIGGVLGAF